LSEATQTSSTPNQPSAAPLVTHSRKREWGRALLLWRRDEKRAYQFEDGNMRVFAERFCDFFQPAVQPDPVLRQKLRERAIAEGHVANGTPGTKSTTRSTGPTPSVADQVSVFSVLFEGGFQSAAWADACRFREKGKALKRHVDPALARAQTELEQDTLRSLIDSGAPQLVVDRIVDIVGSTSLATKTQLDAFRKLNADTALATAFVDFLHDVGGHARGPLDRLRMALAKHGLKNVPWTVLTAARAFLAPETHVFVRPSAMRAQAQLLQPGFKLPSAPTPDAYARCLEMAIGVRNALTKAGLHPRDLLDVVEFMRVTLSRSQRDELLGAMAERMRGGEKPVH
jgi:hypothetical protein